MGARISGKFRVEEFISGGTSRPALAAQTSINPAQKDERGALTGTPLGAGNWDGLCGGTSRTGWTRPRLTQSGFAFVEIFRRGLNIFENTLSQKTRILANLLLNLLRDFRVLLQKGLSILTPLTEALAVIGEPSP